MVSMILLEKHQRIATMCDATRHARNVRMESEEKKRYENIKLIWKIGMG